MPSALRRRPARFAPAMRSPTVWSSAPFSVLSFHGQEVPSLDVSLRVVRGAFLGHWPKIRETSSQRWPAGSIWSPASRAMQHHDQALVLSTGSSRTKTR